jgi:hypothetical protein
MKIKIFALLCVGLLCFLGFFSIFSSNAHGATLTVTVKKSKNDDPIPGVKIKLKSYPFGAILYDSGETKPDGSWTSDYYFESGNDACVIIATLKVGLKTIYETNTDYHFYGYGDVREVTLEFPISKSKTVATPILLLLLKNRPNLLALINKLNI